MKIEKIISQHRRDFTALYKCEHCGQTKEERGYDDAHFHKNVIPNMECGECGKKSPINYRPLTTKYPESQIV